MYSLNDALSFGGPAIFIYFLYTTAHTGYEMWNEKSVKGMSPFPTATLLTNTVIWTMYGFVIGESAVFIPNLIGAIVSFGCVMIHGLYSPRIQWGLYSGCFALIMLCVHFAMIHNTKYLGLAASGLSVLLTAAPLVTLGSVLKEKSTASMPSLENTFALFLSAVLWCAYGIIVVNDVFIYGPNIFGLCMTSFQLLLHSWYPQRKSLH